MKKKIIVALSALSLLGLTLVSDVVNAAGSTVPVFQIDATDTSTYTLTGSTLNSSVTENANAQSGTSSGTTLDSTSPTPSFYFNGTSYFSFANNVKPDLTNGVSIQFVGKIAGGGSWPRLFDFGQSTGWGGGYDNFSIQLGSSGTVEFYMDRSGTTGSYFCGSSNSAIQSGVFAMYSVQVGSGSCSITVNGTSVNGSNSEATTTFASHVPQTSTTWVSKVATMTTGIQSTVTGNIRYLSISSGTKIANSIVFMPNGGTGYTPSQTGSTAVALNANQYIRSGYTFNGWSTNSDGTGTQYADGATFDLSASSRMLFAKWAVLVPSLSISSMSSATYRSNSTISMAINTAGRYTFYASGKRIPGCINISGTSPTVTCTWKPSVIGAISITAKGVISGTNYYSNSSVAIVAKRATTR